VTDAGQWWTSNDVTSSVICSGGQVPRRPTSCGLSKHRVGVGVGTLAPPPTSPAAGVTGSPAMLSISPSKMREITDPILELLAQLHHIITITQVCDRQTDRQTDLQCCTCLYETICTIAESCPSVLTRQTVRCMTAKFCMQIRMVPAGDHTLTTMSVSVCLSVLSVMCTRCFVPGPRPRRSISQDLGQDD